MVPYFILIAKGVVVGYIVTLRSVPEVVPVGGRREHFASVSFCSVDFFSVLGFKSAKDMPIRCF